MIIFFAGKSQHSKLHSAEQSSAHLTSLFFRSWHSAFTETQQDNNWYADSGATEEKRSWLEPWNWGPRFAILAGLWGIIPCDGRCICNANIHSLPGCAQCYWEHVEGPPQNNSLPRATGDGGGRRRLRLPGWAQRVQKSCRCNWRMPYPDSPTGKFLDIYVGNPGSVHDALVLRRCPMYKQSLFPPKGFFLLGDGGYPCLQHPVAIITPYRQPLAGKNVWLVLSLLLFF